MSPENYYKLPSIASDYRSSAPSSTTSTTTTSTDKQTTTNSLDIEMQKLSGEMHKHLWVSDEYIKTMMASLFGVAKKYLPDIIETVESQQEIWKVQQVCIIRVCDLHM